MIFGNLGNLGKSKGNLRRSSEVFGIIAAIFGIPRMTFGSRKCSPAFFGLSWEIFVAICTSVSLLALVLQNRLIFDLYY